MQVSHLNSLDILIACAYFAGTLLIGFLSRRKSKDSSQFLNASRALPVWVAALSFLAVNCGGLEIVGLSAMSAEYGVTALHFYLIGAIPAMIFMALCMIPIYMRSRALSVPEFLLLRFNSQCRFLNSISLLIISALLSGISLYAMAQTLHSFVGWDFLPCTLAVGLLALAFVVLGGLRATIYNELFQLAIIIAGLTPLAIDVLSDFHGIHELVSTLPPDKSHLWQSMPGASPHAPIDGLGVIFGLGFILSFGYWSTDFRLMQRTLTTRSNQDARLVPLLAATGKLFFPLLVLVPGLAAFHTLSSPEFTALKDHNYDQALPLMIHRYYGHGLFGLGLVAILASLMSGLAGNIAAFSSLWTRELYRPYIAPSRSEQHYITVGKISMSAGLVLSVTTAFIALRFRNLMDYIQLLFSLFNAPMLAVFLLGMFTKWATPWGGFCGLLFGILVGCAHNIAARAGLLHYGSQTSTNFYGAIYAWSAAILATIFVSAISSRTGNLQELVFESSPRQNRPFTNRRVWALVILLTTACICLNVIFW